MKRSRFLCTLARVHTEDAARAVVAAARTEHWDARHHCSAMILGPDGAWQRSSDDGEPAGTAGGPMLQVLRGRQVSDVVAVVTRWFGGTLLGAGGLVRAYGDAVRDAMDGVPLLRRVLVDELELAVEHADAGRVENNLRSRGVDVLGTDYGKLALIRLAVAIDRRTELARTLAEAKLGSSQLTTVRTRWRDEPLNDE